VVGSVAITSIPSSGPAAGSSSVAVAPAVGPPPPARPALVLPPPMVAPPGPARRVERGFRSRRAGRIGRVTALPGLAEFSWPLGVGRRRGVCYLPTDRRSRVLAPDNRIPAVLQSSAAEEAL
jgi:hypothetical protein